MTTHPTRRLAVTACAAVLALVPTAAVETAAGAPSTPRPNLVVPTVADPPKRAKPSTTFRVRSSVRNAGRGPAGRSTVRVFLSRDKTRGAGDLPVASGRVGRLPRARAVLVDATVRVPAGARGSYHVITCADAGSAVRESNERDNCRASARTVSVTDTLDADLTGRLVFTDTGSTSTSTSTREWDRRAEVQVSIHVTGPALDSTFASTGSTWSYEGLDTQHFPDPRCSSSIIRREAGGGTMRYTGDPFTDDVSGFFGRQDLSEISMVLNLRYAQSTDNANCEGTTTTSGNALNPNALELTKISGTTSTITYRVTTFLADQGTTSDWDTVTGTLTLARNP